MLSCHISETLPTIGYGPNGCWEVLDIYEELEVLILKNKN
jgi:hypothetical protein